MSNLKDMYNTVHKDDFPPNLVIELAGERLVYEKRMWNINGEEKGLRYGENPDQPAALYSLKAGSTSCSGFTLRRPEDSIISALSEGQMIQAGKHPGKTNLTDVDNGANILQYLTERPAAIILKHNNPCGAAWSDKGIAQAIEAAIGCDRIAAFGGAIVTNRPFSREAAQLVAESYFEVVAAPAFEEGAIPTLKSRKNLRIMELPGLGNLEKWQKSSFLDIKTLADGGLILQKSFVSRINSETDFLPAAATTSEGLAVMARRPTKAELEDLRFAWAVEAGVTSNSVIFARNGATLAIGTGEQDRVGCVELAIHKAYTKYADALAFAEYKLSLYELRQHAADNADFQEKLANIEARTKTARAGLVKSVLVSDGFFPFRDGVDVAIKERVTAIAQPGGSLRDAEIITACNEATPQVGMVFTGQRSFKH